MKRRITEEFIERIKTPNGGWNREICLLIGAGWPLKEGWKKRISGNYIDEKQWEAIQSARKKAHNSTGLF